MRIGFEKISGCLVVSIAGELDHHTAENVRSKIDNKLETMGHPDLILDLSEMNFMDSSGIGVIIGRYKKVSEYGKKLILVNLKQPVRKVLELGGVFTLVQEYNSLEDAIQQTV